MTTDLLTVCPDDSPKDAGRAMLGRRVGSVIVVADAPPEIVTETDLIRATCETDGPVEAISVGTAMSSPPKTIDPDASVRSTLQRMEAERVEELPVTDGLDPVGIVTLSDVALHLPEYLSEVRRIEGQREGGPPD